MTTSPERIHQLLTDITNEAERLSAVPSLHQRPGTGGGTLASERSPALLEALELAGPAHWTRSALGTLHTWAHHLRTAHHLNPPARPTLTTESHLIAHWTDWLINHGYGDNLTAELRELLHRLRTTNHTTPETHGTCHHCGGPITRQNIHRTTWRRHTDRCTLETVAAPDGPASCRDCGARWDDTAALARLAYIHHLETQRPHTDDGRPYQTATELAATHHITVNAARLRLSRAGHKHTRGHYHPDALTPTRTPA